MVSPPLADGRQQIDDPGGEILTAAVAALQHQAFPGKDGRQVLEEHLVLAVFGGLEVDGIHLDQRKVALALLGWPDTSGDGIAGAQVEALDLAWRDVDIVCPGEIGAALGAQEAVAIGKDLQRALAGDLVAILGHGTQDGEDDILFLAAGRSFDLQLIGKCHQLGWRGFLQFAQVHAAFLM